MYNDYMKAKEKLSHSLHVLITKEQHKTLKVIARKSKISMGEVIRFLIISRKYLVT